MILTTLNQRLCGSLWPHKDGAPKPKELVAPQPKSWFVRQKVLRANAHEPEGLLERNIAPSGQWVVYRWIFVMQRSRSLFASQPRMMGLICEENCGEKS